MTGAAKRPTRRTQIQRKRKGVCKDKNVINVTEKRIMARMARDQRKLDELRAKKAAKTPYSAVIT